MLVGWQTVAGIGHPGSPSSQACLIAGRVIGVTQPRRHHPAPVPEHAVHPSVCVAITGSTCRDDGSPGYREASTSTCVRACTEHCRCPVRRAWKHVHKVEPGCVVVVHAAAGGVGKLLSQWAAHLGAVVIGTVGSEAKEAVAASTGLLRREGEGEAGPGAGTARTGRVTAD